MTMAKTKAARTRHAANKARMDALKQEILVHTRKRAKGLRKKRSMCLLWKNGNAECVTVFARGSCEVRVTAASRVGRRTTFRYAAKNTATREKPYMPKRRKSIEDALRACAASAAKPGNKRKGR